MKSPAEYEAEIDRLAAGLDLEARWRRMLAEGLAQERERSDSFEALAVSRKASLEKAESLLKLCLPFVEDCEPAGLLLELREYLEIDRPAEPGDRAIPWDTLQEAMGER